tara:strand:+ start:434 stop:658 length:225 start_codon:yes stop_codon:yes gene_type:complete
MLYWENNDGTFDYIGLVTSGGQAHAAVDNPEDKRTPSGTETGKEGAAPTSSTGTSTPDRPTQNDRWRRSGHSHR